MARHLGRPMGTLPMHRLEACATILEKYPTRRDAREAEGARLEIV